MAAPVVVGLAPSASASPAAAQRLSFVAGTGTYGAEQPGPATSSPLWTVWGTAIDSVGNVYATDVSTNRVVKITPDGTLSFVAGNGIRGDAVPGPATASPLKQPYGIAIDSHDNVYLADGYGYRVEKVTPDGQLSFFAGNGTPGPAVQGPALNSPMNPQALTVDSHDNVYVSDFQNHRVAKVTQDGDLSYFAGNGTNSSPSQGSATSVATPSPFGLATDGADNVYVADSNGYIQKVDQNGTLSFVAGNGSQGPAVEGNARATPLNHPYGVAADDAGNVYIADTYNHRVERVDPAGNLTFVAGTGASGPAVEGPPLASPLNYPKALSAAPDGTVYVVDQNNYRVERVGLADIPAAPTALAAAPGAGSATLTITPGSDGGARITGYEVSVDGGPYASLSTTAGAGTSRVGTVSGLGVNVAHTFAVRAINPMGTGAASPSASATTFDLPAAPTGLTATGGNGAVQLTVTPGTDGGSPITGYEVSVDNGAWNALATIDNGDGTLTGTVAGLPNGVDASISVRAINAAGNGTPTAPVVVQPMGDPIDVAYAGIGGTDSPLGARVGSAITVGGGRAQEFQHGWIYWSSATGAHVVDGEILADYLRRGGPTGPLGFPTTDASPAARGGHAASFTGGSIFWSPATGTQMLDGVVLQRYDALGGPGGLLGYPTSGVGRAPDGVGSVSTFSGGTIYWSPATGAREVHGRILQHYLEMQGPAGPLGYPTSDETVAAHGGRVSTFTRGNVYWSPASGAHEVHGDILRHYLELDGPAGLLGYPVTDETTTPDRIGRFNHFSRLASIYWTPVTRAHEIHGAIRFHWSTLGWERGVAGYPTSDETAVAGGRMNTFSKSNLAMYWSSATGAREVHGAIRTDYVQRYGGPGGALGFPTSDEYATSDGRASRFVHGVLRWTRR